MAVGLQGLPEMYPVAGFRLGTTSAGIKTPGRRDLVVMEMAPDSRCAAVFTRNAFAAAPVLVAREHLAAGAPRYLLVNTGNANAGTGERGLEDARRCCRALASLVDAPHEAVVPFSTGVIGEPLPVEPIEQALPAAHAALTADGWPAAAAGILTTDTVPKGASRRVALPEGEVTITGIAKGSGMIRPDMATMLAFVATDADLPQDLLQSTLQGAVNGSFNRISVDGDTSTNDACVLVATGGSGVALEADSTGHAAFAEAVAEVCVELAQAIVRDGEGATKFITVEVAGGRDEAECDQVAFTVAHSPLVKTAFYAADPNWGRILAAVGRAGVPGLDVGKVAIHLDEVCIVADGGRAPGYAEADGQAVMDRDEITVRIDLARGEAVTRVWTCDLSHDYVRINAEYRT